MVNPRKAATAATILALGITGGIAAAANTVVVTPDSSDWIEVNQRVNGASVISEDQSDRLGGAGSLRQSLTDSSDKTDFRTVQAFGPLADLETLSFDWFRDSTSTAPAHLTPAFEVIVADGDGNSWLLKWEGVYNGYPVASGSVPVDQWVTEDLLAGNYWRIPQYVGGNWVGFSGCGQAGDPYECFVFNRTLADDWLAGYDVLGLTVGVGSGWAGTFISYADLITINDTTFDFEVESPPVDVILTDKAECLDGGWSTSTSPPFRNQGQCVSYFQANEQAGKG